ncbi:heat stress transcription factor B-3 [Humulus lupulus]|uniref:heat stress transcription factor B-3 n=1 Tax=Humulus lupulus TaxID=3486 RepID=UPI002B405574|nr:heat stress transcription factor B-3 [Humulus lupulus]
MEGVVVSSSDDQKGVLELYMRKSSSPPPFLLKTYMLVENPATDEVISWNAQGTAFVVWQPAEFARDLLPTLFKHSNFSSFVRQLNTYGFRKVATNRWEFCNDKFRKGEKDQLCEIRRRKAWANNNSNNKHQSLAAAAAEEEGAAAAAAVGVGGGGQVVESDEDQRSSSTSSSSEFNTLVDENKRLKMENGVLSSELKSMKSKCRELLDLVAKYSRSEKEEKVDDHNDQRPKLFGVRLEVEGEMEKKRKRAQVLSESASILLSQACK